MSNLYQKKGINFLKRIFKKIYCFFKLIKFNFYEIFYKELENHSKVPSILFTSYCCSENDQYIKIILQKWKKLNKKYEIKYFSDQDLEKFFQDHNQYFNTFKKLKNGVSKADFFRLVYLSEYGGYWFDIDLEPFELISPKKGSIHLFDMGFKNISYMLIGGSPNKLFKKTLTQVCKNIDDNYPKKVKDIIDITGPIVIQNIISNLLEINLKDGKFPGFVKSKTYLKNTDFEFEYMCQKNSNLKTSFYRKLQKKYKKKSHCDYEYI